jgi:hypothetical protein
MTGRMHNKRKIITGRMHNQRKIIIQVVCTIKEKIERKTMSSIVEYIFWIEESSNDGIRPSKHKD